MAISRSFGTTVDDRAVNADLALADAFQAGDHGEQSRLAAARGPDEHDKFSRLHLEVDAFQHLGRAEAFVQSRIVRVAMGALSFDGALGQPAHRILAANKQIRSGGIAPISTAPLSIS